MLLLEGLLIILVSLRLLMSLTTAHLLFEVSAVIVHLLLIRCVFVRAVLHLLLVLVAALVVLAHELLVVVVVRLRHHAVLHIFILLLVLLLRRRLLLRLHL